MGGEGRGRSTCLHLRFDNPGIKRHPPCSVICDPVIWFNACEIVIRITPKTSPMYSLFQQISSQKISQRYINSFSTMCVSY